MSEVPLYAPQTEPHPPSAAAAAGERDFLIDNLLVRIHFIVLMIMWTGLAPWEFEFSFPGSLISTFLAAGDLHGSACQFPGH